MKTMDELIHGQAGFRPPEYPETLYHFSKSEIQEIQLDAAKSAMEYVARIANDFDPRIGTANAILTAAADPNLLEKVSEKSGDLLGVYERTNRG